MPSLDLSSFSKASEIPYDFARKRLSVICRDKRDADADLMICKGAITSVLGISSAINRRRVIARLFFCRIPSLSEPRLRQAPVDRG